MEKRERNYYEGRITGLVKENHPAGFVEIKMAKIIRFPVEQASNVKDSAKTLEGATAEIIIFPGIRFEHHGVSFAIAK